jgi:hypothetical protein
LVSALNCGQSLPGIMTFETGTECGIREPPI